MASGGAGEVCIGGFLWASGGGCAVGDTNGNGIYDSGDSDGSVNGSDPTTRYENRGEQGLTIKVKAKFAEAIKPGEAGYATRDTRYDGKGNRFSWTQPNGTTLTLDNFSTSDGPEGGNDYGLNIDLNLDVARTAVKKDITPDDGINNPVLVDSNDNAITLGDISTQGPLGFAVLGRVHFKQLNIDGLKLSATPDSAPQTLISAITIQNADIQANLTATPIR